MSSLASLAEVIHENFRQVEDGKSNVDGTVEAQAGLTYIDSS